MAPRSDRRRIKRILSLLERAYGPRRWRRWGSGVDMLVATILSQNTSGANSHNGYRQLRRRFRSWSRVADAPVGEIAKSIRVCGLSRVKAPRIRTILRRIRDEHGRVSLEFLRDLTPEEACEYLMSFDGVGAKTAGCVMLFAFGRPVFPVDTHIRRIAVRLGLAPARATAEAVQEHLTPLIAPGDRYALHVLLIEHGRRTCRARGPKCQWCDLSALCPDGRRRLGRAGAPRSPRLDTGSAGR